jgi:hypothetical protein
MPRGPAEPHSTGLRPEQEAVIVGVRRHRLLPLDDGLCALQPLVPGLTRSTLHRGLQRHGIPRLPDLEDDKPARTKLKASPIGFVHRDVAEVRTGEGKPCLVVAIDRTSKFAVARLHEEATRPTACQFLEDLLKVGPHRIPTLLTDNAIQCGPSHPGAAPPSPPG